MMTAFDFIASAGTYAIMYSWAVIVLVRGLLEAKEAFMLAMKSLHIKVHEMNQKFRIVHLTLRIFGFSFIPPGPLGQLHRHPPVGQCYHRQLLLLCAHHCRRQGDRALPIPEQVTR